MSVNASNDVIDLVPAQLFAAYSILRSDYHFRDEIASLIPLTTSGRYWLQRLGDKFPHISEADRKAAILGRLAAGNDVLIDRAEVQIPDLMSTLGLEVKNRQINYPFLFGGELGTNFKTAFGPTPVSELNSEQTALLMSSSPQGVFQVGYWVSGPLGILQSDQYRYMPPQIAGPSILCDDRGCRSLHPIAIRTSDTHAGEAYSYIEHTAPRSRNLARMIGRALNPPTHRYAVDHAGELPWMLGNGFTKDELSRLASHLLHHNVAGFRERINGLLDRKVARQPADSITNGLDLAQILQLLLLLPNKALVSTLEHLIETGSIPLSDVEVRRSMDQRSIHNGYCVVHAEASRLGVRLVPTVNHTIARTMALLRDVFSGEHAESLGWQLRSEPGDDPLSKLEHALSRGDFREALGTLVFSSQTALQRTFTHLKYGNFKLPSSPESEKFMLDKILWKLGGPLPTPEPLEIFLERHAASLSEVCVRAHDDEPSRVTALRSTGMNFFVELEALLTDCIDFLAWALLSDHYEAHPQYRFKYSRKTAATFTGQLLADESTKRGDAFPFKIGGNTLSTLIHSFRIIAEMCEDKMRDATAYERPRDQFPDYAGSSTFQAFPFIHKVMFLDLRPDSKVGIVETLKRVTEELTRVDVCMVRNRLGHAGGDVPEDAAVLDSITAVRTAVGLLDNNGLMPIIRVFGGEFIDTLGRRRIRMVDGKMRELPLLGPQQLKWTSMPSPAAPQVIVTSALIRDTLQPLRFQVAIDSEWADQWREFGVMDSAVSQSGVVDGLSGCFRGLSFGLVAASGDADGGRVCRG